MRKLAAMSGGVKGTVFALAEESLTVGRADESMICLDDDQVSRHHALLIAENGEYRVRDLNSANGTYVNGQRVTEARLQPGDHLQIGSVDLVYEKERAKPGAKPLTPVAARTPLPQRQEQVVALGSAVRTMPAPSPVATGTSLPPQPETSTARKARLILWVGVGSAYFILMGWLAHHWFGSRQRVEPPTPVAAGRPLAPENRAPQQKIYSDPRGRFVCAVPDGWRVEEDAGQTRSKLALVWGHEEIRVIAQPAAATTLEEADRVAVVAAFTNALEQARAGGASGRLRDTSWRELGGAKALQVDVEVGAPRYFWMRQVRFRQGGTDHTVAVFAGSPEQRAPMMELFEEFLRSYRSAVAPMPPQGSHQEAVRLSGSSFGFNSPARMREP